jgi:hypothetical protein
MNDYENKVKAAQNMIDEAHRTKHPRYRANAMGESRAIARTLHPIVGKSGDSK